MGRKIADVCMDKESDRVIVYSNGVGHDSGNGIVCRNWDHPESDDQMKGNPNSEILEENIEIKDCDVKECTMENAIEISESDGDEKCNEKEQDVVCVTNLLPSDETEKSPGQKPSNLKKLSSPVKSSSRSDGTGNLRANVTVPQPFSLATEKRASCGTRPVGPETAVSNGGISRPSNGNHFQGPSSTKKPQPRSSLASRKLLQPDNKKLPDEEDASSVASSTASVKTASSRITLPSAPTFKCSERAEKRKEFFSKLEQKQQALEAEKMQCEARNKEEREAALKQLRKTLTFRANPMPSFYHEGPPPKVELKKLPTTRAKSPKLGRRKSFSDTLNSSKGDNQKGVSVRANRHSLGIYKEDTKAIDTNSYAKVKDGPKEVRESTRSSSPKSNEQQMDITVQS